MVEKKEDIIVIKRNGKEVQFNSEKIKNAIKAAATEVNETVEKNIVKQIISDLKDYVSDNGSNKVTIQEIQKFVEDGLMTAQCFDTARAYIVYRAEHDKARQSAGGLMQVYHDITFKSAAEMNDKRDNANIDTDSPMGAMLKVGSASYNYFADNYMLPKEFSKAHVNGDIHIHDKDFYFLTFNCCQIDLLKLLRGGYSTGHGHLREPQEIRSYAALGCIAVQANQNDMFGGQSANAFDYAMADGVRKTFIKKMIKRFVFAIKVSVIESIEMEKALDTLKQTLKKEKCYGISYKNQDNKQLFIKEVMSIFGCDQESLDLEFFTTMFNTAYAAAVDDTEEETAQAMEAVVHNFNSMHSRAGRTGARSYRNIA